MPADRTRDAATVTGRSGGSRATDGLDGVQSAFGHRTLAVAERYAEVEAEKADWIAATMG